MCGKYKTKTKSFFKAAQTIGLCNLPVSATPVLLHTDLRGDEHAYNPLDEDSSGSLRLHLEV